MNIFLEQIELHDILNPLIWTEKNELKEDVKEAIIKIVDKFKETIEADGLKLDIEDIYILGSNANYNYNEESDLDVHIIANEKFDCEDKHLELLYNCYKSLFNLKYDIYIKDINVELYVENKDDLSNISNGVYSLNQEKWLKNPSKNDIPEIDNKKLNKEVVEWENKYYNIINNPNMEQIEKYINDIYNLRQNSIKNDGEFGLGNLIFKEIRRLDYLNDLKDLRNELISKDLSLESLQETYKISGTDLNTRIKTFEYLYNELIKIEDFKNSTSYIKDLISKNYICYSGAFIATCYYNKLGFDTDYVLGYLSNKQEDLKIITHAWCEANNRIYQTNNPKKINCNELDRISFKANTDLKEIKNTIINKFKEYK